MSNQNNEIWASIPGFEGIYEISNMGRVRSFERIVRGRLWPGRELKVFGMPKTGYLAFNARDKENSRTILLARMVALLFVEKPDGWTDEWFVTYRNHDKKDCRAENLVWVPEFPGHKKRGVVQLTKTGEFIKEFESLWEASKETGIFQGNISYAATKERKGNKTAGGFKWKYAEDYYADNI